MRLKSITKQYLITNTRGYTKYDGSFWAITNVVAIRLPEDYELRGSVRGLNDNFIPNLIEHDQELDSFYMDIDDYINKYWKHALRNHQHIVLHLNDKHAYNSKYVKMFNWHTDARYLVNLNSGLMYVKESITDVLMGLILPIKLKGGDQK